jgi:ketosteroid isomerase-like protein
LLSEARALPNFQPGPDDDPRQHQVMRVKDGLVVEGRDYYDSATIVRQLGLVD